MKEALDRYIDYLQSYCEFLVDMVRTENNVLEALLSHNTATIESTLTKQQASAMQLKSYEDMRIKKQIEAGFPGNISLSQIVEATKGEQQQYVRQCMDIMQNAVGQIQFISDKIKQVAQTNLRILDLSVAPEERKESMRYTEDGKQNHISSHIFETEV